jgi:hypothetical protein
VTATLVSRRHDRVGFRLPVPDDWECVEDPQPGVALVALEPDSGAGFRANLVVTVDALPEGEDLVTWQAGSDALMARDLDDYVLLHLDLPEPDGSAPFVHRLAHHAVGGTEAVTMRQWAIARGRTGVTLTASVTTLAYDSMADTFDAVGAAFEVDDSPGGSPRQDQAS